MSKIYHWRFVSLIVLVLMTLSLSAVTAQDSLGEQPLLKMLAHVPDNATSRSEIYFNDRKAVEIAYPPAKMPSDWAEFSQLPGDANLSPELMAVDVWWRVWRDQQSSRISQYMLVSDEMPTVIGFDFFTVEQELNYGQPPQQTMQLNGQFDLDKVRSALTTQGFTQQDQAGVEVWCGPDGCDSGAKVNVRDRNPANPFGGDLGRKWPIIVQANNLIGSPDLEVIQNHSAIQNGSGSSLGEAPEYRAAVEALTQNGVLMQAHFWDGDVLAAMSKVPGVIIAASVDKRKAIIEAILQDYEPLPVYKLLVFGDIAGDVEVAGEAVLVYDSEADAEKAAEILPKRIANFTTLSTQQSLTKMLNDRGVTQPDVQVVESNGHYIVLVSFASAKASVEDIMAMQPAGEGGSEGITPPGSLYRLLVGLAMRGDLGWLSTISREDLEAAAK